MTRCVDDITSGVRRCKCVSIVSVACVSMERGVLELVMLLLMLLLLLLLMWLLLLLLLLSSVRARFGACFGGSGDGTSAAVRLVPVLGVSDAMV